MTTLIRVSFALSALAVAMLGVAACSGDVTGTATTSSDAPPTTASSPLASIEPCSLVSLDDQARLVLDPGKPDNTSTSRGCEWAKGTSYTVGIYLDDTQSIEAAGTAGATVVTLQSHDAVQTTPQGFGCGVDIAISKTSSVAVNVSTTTDDCQLAQQYAGMIEPKLPAQRK